jgi:hypothetical protein
VTGEGWRAVLAADPRFAKWRATVAAAQPPLTQEQITALRPICQRMGERIRAAAAARAASEHDAAPRT